MQPDDKSKAGTSADPRIVSQPSTGCRSRSRSSCSPGARVVGRGADGEYSNASILEEYEAWLKERGVWWDPRVQLRPPSPAANGQADQAPAYMSGWGFTCLESVPRGTEIVRVPAAAALTVDALVDVEPSEGNSGGESEGRCASARVRLEAAGVPKEFCTFREDVDCQLALAVALLLAREGSSWRPKLRPEVTPRQTPLPWAWPGHSGLEVPPALRGTELEAPVAAKRQRLWGEAAKAQDVLKACRCRFDDYIEVCAVVMSRVQPWFGGSLVPFVDQANHAWVRPHVEFRRRGATVVGRTVRELVSAGEILQSYGDLSTADSLYRYGFVSAACSSQEIRVRSTDVVTISAELLERAAAGALAAEAVSAPGVGAAPEVKAATVTLRQCRRPLLQRADLLEESPWDGVEDSLGLELSLGPSSGKGKRLGAAFEVGQRRVRGLQKLLLAAQLLVAPALAGPGSGKLPAASASAPTPAAAAVALAAVRARDALYPGGALAADEADFSSTATQRESMESDGALRRGSLLLRIVERRILAATLQALTGRLAAVPDSDAMRDGGERVG